MTLETAACTRAMSEETGATWCEILCTSCPPGLRHRSLQIENLPVASENLASVRCKEDYVEFPVFPAGRKKYRGGARWKRNCAPWPVSTI